ncbi:MAG: DNA-directed RNA polymerase subunit alpha [Patescibacteria group bacterium]|nr:DNA-directed RNA polymerase subunit alpha [Patescibacteria group bacterium]MDE2014942.1 DNA-directed RNA polymerase subunit alpha [Patescibacteria group bacterium]MDE2226371.1 DNA-directed RNA polymerase subunit alpha [Patescibacteria group bacterium]
MQFTHLSETVTIKTVSEDSKKGTFEVEGLFAGYGLTVGNALRRVLLSSLPGAAVTEIKVKNAPHEFSTLPGLKEDLVELSLNFKRLRFKMHIDEPQVLILKVKGEKVITAADIKTTSEVEIMNPDEPLATLTSKDAELEIEVKVERGLGYSAVESRKEGRLNIGTIAIDAIFTPVTKVNFVVEDMRVGDRTDYNRLRLEVETDGTISPSSALHKSANVLKDHFEKISVVAVQELAEEKVPAAEDAPKKKVRSKKAEKAE